MSKQIPAPQKKNIFSYFKKFLDGVKSSVDYLKSIKEIFIIGLSISALFLTDVPKDAVNQVKNLTASIIQRQPIAHSQVSTTPKVQAMAPEGVRRASQLPEPIRDPRLIEKEGALRLNLRETSEPIPPRESFQNVRVLETTAHLAEKPILHTGVPSRTRSQEALKPERENINPAQKPTHQGQQGTLRMDVRPRR